MFIGHFGAGFGAKKISATPSLGTLLMASQFIDLLWPLFLILGIEKVTIDPGNTAVTPLDFIYYPFSHSLLGVLFWALIFGSVYYFFKKNLKVSLLLGILVISHWVLDLIVHRPDLPLTPWQNIMLGFGLWNSVAGTILVEGAIFLLGVYFYSSVTKAKNKKGSFGFYGLVILLILIYVMNLFGPPPSDVEPIGYVGMAQWLFIIWGYWIDRNRSAIESQSK